MTTEMLDSIVSPHSQELPNASSALKLFENPQFKIRVIMRLGDPWFVAKDACDCLDLGNVSQTCSRLDDDERGIISIDTPSGKQEMLIVSEPGLYSLIGSSKKQEAKAFKRWVNHEVLPSIRKTGSYSIGQTQSVMLPNFCNPAEAARAWADLYEKNQATEKRAITAEAERDEAIRTKTQYQSNLAAQMSGRVGGLTTALNRVRLENDRLKGDRLTKEDVYTIMDTQGVSFTLKTVKDVIRDELNIISEYLKEPFPKIPTGGRTDPNGKTFEVKSFVYTRKSVRVFFEFVENNPMEWQARNRKSILNEWLNHHMTRPA